jgi:hypothetical protein
MAETNETKILGNKATVYTNKFGVWFFRLWLAEENKYVRKSLKTKKRHWLLSEVRSYIMPWRHN